jgi:hypothetical protein
MTKYAMILLLSSVVMGCTHKIGKIDHEYCDPIIEYDYPFEFSYEMEQNNELYKNAPLFSR